MGIHMTCADVLGEQIAIGQLLTYLFRKWNEKPDPLKPE